MSGSTENATNSPAPEGSGGSGGSGGPRVLIGCPTYRLEPETVDAIFRQDYRGPYDVLFGRDNPNQRAKLDHMHQYNRLRQAVLDGGYDFLLTIESDIIPPPDALSLLIETAQAGQAGAVLGTYMFRGPEPQINITPFMRGFDRPDMNMSLSKFPELLARSWDQVIPCNGLGLGCALISRGTLEAVPFRLEEFTNAHCDWHWVTDMSAAGRQILADLRVLCGHRDPTGRILWPDPDAPDYYVATNSTLDESPWHYWRAYEEPDPQN